MVGDQLELGDDVYLKRAWDDTLRILSAQVNRVTFESYIKTIRPVSSSGSAIILGVSNAFAREWLRKYLDPIRAGLEEHYPKPVEIQFVIVSSDEKPALGDRGLDSLAESPVKSSPGRRVDRVRVEDIPSIPLDEKFSFENYLTARSNRLAHSAAIAVASAPGRVYNPLFIYGSPGLGKTHLLNAIGNAVRKENSKLRVVMIDGETFTQYFVSALRERKVEEFRKRVRSVDIWLVDDIQSIASREQTREEFFHTYNALHQTGKQIVICSDRSPRYLHTLDERLRSRLESGLVADVSSPELETRESIMIQKCEVEGWHVPQEVIFYIAQAIQSNVRALEGALTKLVAYCSIEKLKPSIDVAQEILGEYFLQIPSRSHRMKSVSIEAIQIATADEYGTTQEHLKSESRDRDITLARQVAMFLSRELTHEALKAIGEAFGREHTTVQRAHAKINLALHKDLVLGHHITEIRERLER